MNVFDRNEKLEIQKYLSSFPYWFRSSLVIAGSKLPAKQHRKTAFWNDESRGVRLGGKTQGLKKT